jgi:hypothetical protein
VYFINLYPTLETNFALCCNGFMLSQLA